jgi:glutaconate CoA-transferase subunit A
VGDTPTPPSGKEWATPPHPRHAGPGQAPKVLTLAEAVARIPQGAVVGLGGNTFHRAPVAAVHELVRQRRRVGLVKSAGSYEVDVLVGAELVERIEAAYVGFETLGLAPRYRRALEAGELTLTEHT